MTIISDFDKNRLAKKTLQQEYLTNKYLENEQDENFKYIKKKFFYQQDIDEAKVLNVGSGLFQSISDTYSYYVGSPIGDMQVDLSESTKDLFSNGYIILAITAQEGEYNIERVPTNLHFYNYALEADVVLRLYAKGTDSTLDTYNEYLLQTVYYENRIENNLYKLNKSGEYNTGVLVPLDEIEETKNLQPVESTTYKPLWIIKKDNLDQYPVSEAEKIKPLVYSIDRKTVMFETQFLRNTETLKLFKGIHRPKDGGKSVSYNETGHEIYTTNDQAQVEFIDNVNALIKDAIEYESNQIRRISSISKVPTDFLGLDNAHGAIGEGSRSVLHGAFYKKVRDIQKLYDTQLREIYEIVAKENGAGDTYRRPDVYIKDDKELLEELIQAKNENIITHTRAIMEYLNIDEEQALEEKETIMSDNKEAQDLLLESMPDDAKTQVGGKDDKNKIPNDAKQG